MKVHSPPEARRDIRASFWLRLLFCGVSLLPAGGVLSARVPDEPQISGWSGTLSRMPTDAEDVVITTDQAGHRSVRLRPRDREGVALAPLPLFGNLLPHSAPQAFGADRRCTVVREGSTARLTCSAGPSTAGVVFAFEGFRLPTRAELQAKVAFTGARGLRAQFTPKGHDADALQVVGDPGDRIALSALGNGVPPQLVIVAPPQGGEWFLQSVEIAEAEQAAEPGDVSAWAWTPELWQTDPESLINNAISRGVTRLFVTLEVPGEAVEHAADLRRFIAMAHEAGVRVEAVEGDPRMVLDDGLEGAVRRARAFARYQQSASAAGRLDGIQYDIEPYVLDGWKGGAADYRAWGDAVLRLAEATQEHIDLVVPFWITSSPHGEAFLARVAPVTRGLTVMSYRTNAAVLSQIAEPLLAWGSGRGKPIRLALEAGPLSDEVEEVYRPAVNGTLALVDGSPPRLMQMDKPGVVPDARMYRLSHRTTIRGTDLSFQGHEDAMISLAARTSPTLRAWPAFSGFALHGLVWNVSEPSSPGGQ